MPDDFSLDPELKAIFEEIASGPNTLLAYLPRRKALRGIDDHETPVSPKSPGLTRAEKHLLEVHRERAAAFLRRVFGSRLISDPKGSIDFQRHTSATVVVPLEDYASQARAARGILSVRAVEAENDPTNDILSSIGHGKHACLSTPLQIALAAYRLDPCDSSRVHVAMDSIRMRKPRQAIRTLHRVLENGCSSSTEPYAWEILGMANSREGQYKRALNCYKTASYSSPDHYLAALSILFLSIQLAMEEKIIEEAVRVDDLLAHDHPAVESFVARHNLRRIRGDWTPSSASARALDRVVDNLKPAARRIASVFL